MCSTVNLVIKPASKFNGQDEKQERQHSGLDGPQVLVTLPDNAVAWTYVFTRAIPHNSLVLVREKCDGCYVIPTYLPPDLLYGE